jgi:hypothetical protein
MPDSEKTSDDPWRIDPSYPLADWVQEVTNDDTRLGYLAWVKHQLVVRAEAESPYTVLVGNVGNIDCETLDEAEETYAAYCILSRARAGRASGETVTLMRWPDDIIKEFTPRTHD